MRKHEENKDLNLFKKVGNIDFLNKCLEAPRGATIGIRMWGRIDYLTHYCGWHFIWNNDATAKVAEDKEEKKKKNKEKPKRMK